MQYFLFAFKAPFFVIFLCNRDTYTLGQFHAKEVLLGPDSNL